MVITTTRPLYPGEDPVSIGREAGWDSGLSWRARKIRPTAIPSLDLPAPPYVDYCMPPASRQECIASNVWMKDVEKRR